MGNDKQQLSPLIPKLINFRVRLGHVFHFLFFVIGLSIGITVSFYLKNFFFNFNLQANLFSLLPSPPRLPLPPTPQTPSLLKPLSPPLSPPPPPPPPPPLQTTSSLKPLSPPRSPPQSHSSFSSNVRPPLMHNVDDDELFLRAKRVLRIQDSPDKPIPKVAFMFLTKGPLPLGPLWEKFFQGHEELYTIYIHPHPSYNDSLLPEDSIFYNRRIPSKEVKWGKPSMIDAERRLLANALLDISNKRFVLLSESCIPLFNFTTIYNYIMNSDKNFIGSWDDPREVGRGRYNPKMFPTVNITNWRKGSQWFEVNRKLALEIISDTKYYPVFQEYCSPPCYMDEHYIPTLVNIRCPEENSNRPLTWVDWSQSGPHPGRFVKQSISAEFLDRIRFGNNCTYNGNTTSICHLFARKFVANTLQPLLQIAPTLLQF